MHACVYDMRYIFLDEKLKNGKTGPLALNYARQYPVDQRQASMGGSYLLERKIVQSYERIDPQKLRIFVDKTSIHEPRGGDDPTISHRKGI